MTKHTSLQGAVLLSVSEAIQRQVELVTQLRAVSRTLKSSRIKAARATEQMREMLGEAGSCGELAHMRVPSLLDPTLLLNGETSANR